jgi:hypothetical protein
MRSVLLVFVMAACAPSPQGPVHAPGAPPEASPVSMSTGGSAPEPSSGWFCYVKRSGDAEQSWCERSLEKCKSAGEIEMGAARPGDSWSTCAAADRAFCYGFHEQKTERAIDACYETRRECEHVLTSAIDLSTREGDGYPIAGTVRPCVESP